MNQKFRNEITRMETQFQQVATDTLKETLAKFGVATTKKMEEFNTETAKRFTTHFDFEELTKNVQMLADAVNLLVNNAATLQPHRTTTLPSPPRKQTRSDKHPHVYPNMPGTLVRQLDTDMDGAGDDL